jgi:hypothetical protein
MKILRLVAIGWLMHFEQLAKAPFEARLTALWSIVNAELAIGATYATAGYLALRYFELQARRHATLGLA